MGELCAYDLLKLFDGDSVVEIAVVQVRALSQCLEVRLRNVDPSVLQPDPGCVLHL